MGSYADWTVQETAHDFLLVNNRPHILHESQTIEMLLEFFSWPATAGSQFTLYTSTTTDLDGHYRSEHGGYQTGSYIVYISCSIIDRHVISTATSLLF
jgi:hypothetical protein